MENPENSENSTFTITHWRRSAKLFPLNLFSISDSNNFHSKCPISSKFDYQRGFQCNATCKNNCDLASFHHHKKWSLQSKRSELECQS